MLLNTRLHYRDMNNRPRGARVTLTTLSEPDANATFLFEILDIAIVVANAQLGTIQLIDSQTGELKIAAQRGLPQWWLDYGCNAATSPKVSDTPRAQIKQVIVADIENDPSFAGTSLLEVKRRAGIRAFQTTPLISRKGECLGMISTYHQMPCRLGARALHALKLLARQAAEAISRANTKSVRRKPDELFRSFWHKAEVGAALMDRNGRCTYVNDHTCHITGYSRDEIVGHCGIPGLDLQDRAGANSADMRTILEGQASAQDCERRYVCKDGQIKWLRIRLSAIRDETGEVEAMAAVIEDVSELKKRFETLRKSRDGYRCLIDSAAAVTWSCTSAEQNVKGQFNRMTFTDQTGDERLDAGWIKDIHPDDVEFATQRWQEAARQATPYHNLYRVRRNDGKWRWMSVYAVHSRTPTEG